jgi:hypothetical protein
MKSFRSRAVCFLFFVALLGAALAQQVTKSPPRPSPNRPAIESLKCPLAMGRRVAVPRTPCPNKAERNEKNLNSQSNRTLEGD